jgi:hypothetical protein
LDRRRGKFKALKDTNGVRNARFTNELESYKVAN